MKTATFLISDFSGVIFDGFKLKKRVVLFATDFEKYISEERGLYFDFRNLPFIMTQTNDELEQAILQFDDSSYEVARQVFVEKLGFYQADGAELVANRIKEVVQGGDAT